LKKLAAILFLSLFLFNLAGYKCWYYFLQDAENTRLEANLDKNNYSEQDLILFKVPLSNPYQISWTEFERVDGEIDIQGVMYKYVKRKVEDGQLILLCLPNYNKMKLAKVFSEFGHHGNDYSTSGKKNNNTPCCKIVSLSEYEENPWTGFYENPDAPALPYTAFLHAPLTTCYIGLAGKPPEIG